MLAGDEANIGKYEFNNRMLYKTFCRICGVGMTNSFRDVSEEEAAKLPEVSRKLYERQHAFTGVNVRVLHGVDADGLKTIRVDGLNNIPGEYVNP